MNPDQYEDEYAESYRKFAESHQRTLLKTANQRVLKAVEDYFKSIQEKPDGDAVSVYKPDLTVKRPSELKKVEILEETVLKGTLEDLKDVIKTYKPFEFTARALGLACRYRGIEFVREMIKNGATFEFQTTPVLMGKYDCGYRTTQNLFKREYYLILISSKQDLEYYSINSLACNNVPEDYDGKVLPLKDRLEILEYLSNVKKSGISLKEMLYWSLLEGEIEFADALIAMGVNLKNGLSRYCEYSEYYMNIITKKTQTLYRRDFIYELGCLSEDKILPVLERLNTLVAEDGKRIAVNQYLFDELKWDDALLSFIFKNTDISMVNQKKSLEKVISRNDLASLTLLAEEGWLKQPARRDNLIEYARDNNYLDALAWLIDFKARTADFAAEEKRKEKQELRKLTENPNSIAALRKIWGFDKLEDGTLRIKNYKGNETDVVIPSKIGKANVTVIDDYAFSPKDSYISQSCIETREKIRSVSIPEGVIKIERRAFYGCESLETVYMPETIQTIGEACFEGCTSLNTIHIPAGIKSIKEYAFSGCTSLEEIVIPNTLQTIEISTFSNCKSLKTVHIPARMKLIKWSAFSGCTSLEDVVISASLQSIEGFAFEDCTNLKNVTSLKKVKSISDTAFYGCESLKREDGFAVVDGIFLGYYGENEAIRITEDVEQIVSIYSHKYLKKIYIPESVKTIGTNAFAYGVRLKDLYISAKTKSIGEHLFGKITSQFPTGLYVHTPAGSAAEEQMKNYEYVIVINDYSETENH